MDWTTGLDYWTGLLDWTTGLDYWTGLLDSRKLPLEEKGTPMRRAKTPGHKVCSSVVVTHLKVASSSVPSHSAHFFCCCIWTGTWAWLHLDPVLTSVHGHYSCVMQCSRVAGCSSFVLTAVLFFHLLFFVMNAECGTRCSSQIVIRFRSGLCLWNGKLGFEALLSFVPRITAPIFDCALAPGSN